MNTRRTLLAAASILVTTLSPQLTLAQEQSPPLADSVVDLRTSDGAARVAAEWHFAPAPITDADFFAPGTDNKPGITPVKTHDVSPRVGAPEFENAPWERISPESLETRRTKGKLAFGWYRLSVTLPEHVGSLSTNGTAAVLEVVVDDYAEIWVNGALPLVLGQNRGPVATGWNTPTRILLTHNGAPGQHFDIAIFAANAPLSAPPANYVWVRSATLDFYKPGRSAFIAPTSVKAEIVRLDPAFDAIVAPGTEAQRLAGGLTFAEGPVWVPQLSPGQTYGGGGVGNYLLFSDPNKNVIHRWDPNTGELSIFRTKSGYSGTHGADIGEYHQPGSNGLALSPDGKLTICEHGNRRVTRLEPNGSITVLADRYEGRRLNSPNDLVYRSDGTLFFTDPPFGLPKVFDDPRKELPFSGVYCVYNGQLKLLTTELTGPNGLAFSPDESRLYVDNWDETRKVIMQYDVASDGALSNPTTFVDLTNIPGEICFDGLKVDSAGNVYAAAPGGIRVYSRDAKHLGTIAFPELPANFAFGGADRRTLYVAARTSLYRVPLQIPSLR